MPQRFFSPKIICRTVAVVVLLAYAITWSFGVPAVITDIHENDTRQEAAASEFYHTKSDPIESVVTFALPALPGVVVAYHHHSGGHLHGWGGWKVYFWYIRGEKQLFEVMRWVT